MLMLMLMLAGRKILYDATLVRECFCWSTVRFTSRSTGQIFCCIGWRTRPQSSFPRGRGYGHLFQSHRINSLHEPRYHCATFEMNFSQCILFLCSTFSRSKEGRLTFSSEFTENHLAVAVACRQVHHQPWVLHRAARQLRECSRQRAWPGPTLI